MSGSPARKMRRHNLVRASARDDVLLQTAQRVVQLEHVINAIIQVLEQNGIRPLEPTTPSGIIVPR